MTAAGSIRVFQTTEHPCGYWPERRARDIVLDPFGGTGTTAMVAVKLGRSAIAIELNPAYVEIARKRLDRATAQGQFEL
jgi:DNA modification methylase